jgi:hypothetical protein
MSAAANTISFVRIVYLLSVTRYGVPVGWNAVERHGGMKNKSRWLLGLLAAVVPLLSTAQAIGGCDAFMCGTNHNQVRV